MISKSLTRWSNVRPETTKRKPGDLRCKHRGSTPVSDELFIFADHLQIKFSGQQGNHYGMGLVSRTQPFLGIDHVNTCRMGTDT